MYRSDIINRIREKLDTMPAQTSVILFGSQARGDARPDSDVDLLIIVSNENITELEQQAIIYPLFHIGYETGVLINPIVVTKGSWGKIKSPFYENVMREGIVL